MLSVYIKRNDFGAGVVVGFDVDVECRCRAWKSEVLALLYRYMFMVHWTFFRCEWGVTIVFRSEGVRAFNFVEANSGTR